MNVTLFHTFFSERRVSMEVYAQELGRALRETPEAVSGALQVEDFMPHVPALLARAADVPGAGPVARYAARYGGYQWQAWNHARRRRRRRSSGEVYHIVDHGYGHLAFSLDARRTVVTFHDAMLLRLRAGELPAQRAAWSSVAGHQVSLAAIRRVARVVADSESSKHDFLRFTDYDPTRVRVVPLGVSDRFSPPPEPALRRLNGRPLRLLHVGHCGFYKNIEGILRALPRLRTELDVPVVFTKVGGPFTVEQRTLIGRLGVADQIEHLGSLSPDGLLDAYRRADALLLPSLHEGFGLPALEAMASGTPVIASTRGPLPEVIGDAGLLIESTDSAAIAAAVGRLFSDHALYDDLRRRGLERAATFSWARTASAMLDVYREVDHEAG